MKKLCAFLVLFIGLISTQVLATETSMPASSASHGKQAQNTVTLYFFWSTECPHCVAAHPFIDKLKAEYPWLRVKSYNVSGQPRNGQLFEKMAREHGRETSFVPTFFICDKMIVGFSSVASTGAEIRAAIKECHARSQ